MKKKFAALVAAFVLGGAIFAENHTKGIDLQLGIPIAKTKMTMDLGIAEFSQETFGAGGQLKIATYDCFLLNDMLGIYASLGLNPGVFIASTSSDGEGGIDDVGFSLSLEFMVGPAFGIDLGGVRFQTGLAFHAVFAWGWYGGGSTNGGDWINNKVNYNSFGFALTPQFRFGASKRCSFILGCDLAFDFPKKLTLDLGGTKIDVEFDKGFRFGATPYIGLGINF